MIYINEISFKTKLKLMLKLTGPNISPILTHKTCFYETKYRVKVHFNEFYTGKIPLYRDI